MKNYLNQLVTNLYLRVTVDNRNYFAPLHENFQFSVDQTVIIDNIEILPKYQNLAVNRILEINEPFYAWYHKISGQGWLLVPH